MTANKDRWLSLDTAATYHIQVQGRLDKSWSPYFGGMAITSEKRDDRPTITTLSGTVADQAALHGLLTRIRDLGLPLLSVQYEERSSQ